MQAARDLVRTAAELAAGVQLGQHHLGRRQADAGHLVHRDTAAIVRAGHPAIRMDGHDDVIAAPLKSLVDAVVDHLLHQVVKPPSTGRADVHARPAANRLEPLENCDVFGVVTGVGQMQTRLNIGETGISYGTKDPRRSGRQELSRRLRIGHVGPHKRGGHRAAERLVGDPGCERTGPLQTDRVDRPDGRSGGSVGGR